MANDVNRDELVFPRPTWERTTGWAAVAIIIGLFFAGLALDYVDRHELGACEPVPGKEDVYRFSASCSAQLQERVTRYFTFEVKDDTITVVRR